MEERTHGWRAYWYNVSDTEQSWSEIIESERTNAVTVPPSQNLEITSKKREEEEDLGVHAQALWLHKTT